MSLSRPPFLSPMEQRAEVFMYICVCVYIYMCMYVCMHIYP